MRLAVAASAGLLLAALGLVVAGSAAPPLSRACAAPLVPSACDDAVDAVLRRGLPSIHPLILATRVEPGPAAGSEQQGHRATVVLDLLGVPGPTSIELHFDAGGHWGGVPTRSEAEVTAWAMAPVVVAGLVSLALVALGWRRPTPSGGGA